MTIWYVVHKFLCFVSSCIYLFVFVDLSLLAFIFIMFCSFGNRSFIFVFHNLFIIVIYFNFQIVFVGFIVVS
jgi:hypothetical protein